MKILIVDDSRSMRKMVQFTLEESGHQVSEAENGKQASEMIDGLAPELVITDLNMPEMDGIELIKHIRQSSTVKFVPIIVLTTESEEQKQKEGIRAGATAWLVKPFTPDILLNTVNKVAR